MFKKCLACLLLVCLCLSLTSAASASGAGEWSFDPDSGVLRLSGEGTMDELFAARSGGGFFSSVALPWRSLRESIRFIEIDGGITSVSDFAFEGCTNLETVELPEGLERIGNMAFNGCSALRRVVLPASLAVVESFAFCGCRSLNDVVYSGTSANWSAVSVDVYNDALTSALRMGSSGATPEIVNGAPNTPSSEEGTEEKPSADIPAAVQTPSDDVSAPPAVVLPAGTPTLSGSCGSSANWSFYRAEGLLLIHGRGAMADYRYSAKAPWDELSHEITWVVVDSGITAVGDYAFYGLGEMLSLSLPEGLEAIGYSSFSGCKSLTEVTFPASLKELSGSAFEDCSMLGNLYVTTGGISFCSVDGVVFSADGQTLVLFPKARAGSYAVPAGVKTIGEDAFADCDGLTRVILPEGLTVISYSAFHFCRNLELVDFPSTLLDIEGFAFSGCYKLRELNLPEGLRSLSTWSFYTCDALTSVVLPVSLEHIADGTFCNCENLTEITVARGNPYFRSVDGLLYSSDYSTLYAVPAGRIGAVTVVDGVTLIYEDAARDCGSITSITLPMTLKKIDLCAFSGCPSLETVRYVGSKSQWSQVEIGGSNDNLLDASFVFLG